jgi:hypothetical protein
MPAANKAFSERNLETVKNALFLKKTPHFHASYLNKATFFRLK